MALGTAPEQARSAAAVLLAQLGIPERLWSLPPATFSGGEQQRINLARGLVHPYPVLLLDEPTASLDAANRAVVVALIGEAKARGAAILAICHDEEVRAAIATRTLDLATVKAAA
jgi:alpha-D-ribose 1-methylphosphonate 5-triphosphate synthase subunit PhnL